MITMYDFTSRILERLTGRHKLSTEQINTPDVGSFISAAYYARWKIDLTARQIAIQLKNGIPVVFPGMKTPPAPAPKVLEVGDEVPVGQFFIVKHPFQRGSERFAIAEDGKVIWAGDVDAFRALVRKAARGEAA